MFKEAKHIYKWFLKTFGYVAIVNPFSLTCYVLEGYFPPSVPLKAHEDTHFKQIKKDGRIIFCLKYLWYILLYGYTGNPYEIEAKQKENETLQKYI